MMDYPIITYRGIQPCAGTDISDMVCFNNPETRSTGNMDMFYFNIKYKPTGTVWNGEEVYQHIHSHIKLPSRNDNIAMLLDCADDIRYMIESMKQFPEDVQKFYHDQLDEMYKKLDTAKLEDRLIEGIHKQYKICYEQAMQYEKNTRPTSV